MSNDLRNTGKQIKDRPRKIGGLTGDELVVIQNPEGGPGSTFSAPIGQFAGVDSGLRNDLAQSGPDKGAELVSFQQAGAGAVVRDQLVKSREVVTPYDFGAVGDGITDDSDAIDRFTEELNLRGAVLARCDGQFAVSRPVFFGPASGTIKTLNISGRADFRALGPMDAIVTFRRCGYLVWDGTVTASGPGGEGTVPWADRLPCRVGIRITSSARSRFGGMEGYAVWGCGVQVDNVGGNTSLANLGSTRFRDVGSGHPITGGSLTADWSAPVNSGSSGSPSQRTVISVTALPPEGALLGDADNGTPVYVDIGGQPYWVVSIDRSASTLTLFPWVDNTLTSGELTYIIGGGVVIAGGDSSVLNIDQVDATRCGIGVVAGALYGPTIKRLVSQFCGASFLFGKRNNSAVVTFSINGLYSEANRWDFIRATSYASVGGNILCEYALDLNKLKYASAPRLTNNSLSQNFTNMEGLQFSRYGRPLSYEKRAQGFTAAGSSLTTVVNETAARTLVFERNSWTVNLEASKERNDHFGYDSCQFVFVGTGSRGAPTGAFTFNPPAGWTVNGGASIVFAGFDGPASFAVSLNFTTLDAKVFCLNQQLQAQANYNPPSLNDGDGVTTTVTVSGAALGDVVAASFGADLQGVALSSWVSAADTVSVRFVNLSGGTVDLPSATIRVRVRKA